MNVYGFLSGFSGAETLSFFLSGANIIFNTVFCVLLEYFPLRKFLRVKPVTAVLMNLGLVVINIVFLGLFPAIVHESGKGQIFGLVMYLTMFVPLTLYLLKGCFFQNLFLIAFCQCSTQFIFGLGNFAEFRFGDLLFPDVHYEVALITKLLIYVVFFPLSTKILGNLFAAWDKRAETESFWRALWIIPLALCTLTAISGTVATLTDETSMSFLLARIFSMAALIVCIVMMTDIMNIERETAENKLKEEMIKTADEASERSRKKARKSLDEMHTARADTRAAVTKILAFSAAGRHDEIGEVLREGKALLDTFRAARFCDNDAVNALVSYYEGIAKAEGISVSCRLEIPGNPGKIAGVDLSRIIGNMLENAIEACRMMEYGAKKISLQSRVSGDMLIFGMNNSFDGEVRKNENGEYISRKRESGIATGLRSIRAVAEKYNGSVKFESADRVFKTSVRLDMKGE